MAKKKLYLVIDKVETEDIKEFQDIDYVDDENVFIFLDPVDAENSMSGGDMLLELTVDRISTIAPTLLNEVVLE